MEVFLMFLLGPFRFKRDKGLEEYLRLEYKNSNGRM